MRPPLPVRRHPRSTWPDGGLLVGFTGGLAVGVLNWFVIAFARSLRAPIAPEETISPADLLRLDRGTALSNGLICGLGVTVVIELAFVLALDAGYGVVSVGYGWVAFLFLGTAMAMAVWLAYFTVWGMWLLARIWLPLRGDLPWAVMAFLADAHRRGVLRQSGGVYQFRHARLQEHLMGPAVPPATHALPEPSSLHALPGP